MKYLSICSGIEAASVAWSELNWEAIGFSEIDPFASAVLKYRYPNTVNFGNMENYEEWKIGSDKIDLLVGGTPCQSYSIGGGRKGLDDERGKLAIKFFDLAKKFKPRWIIWENVVGVLSSNKGRDFAVFLSEMAKCGYGFSYRVLDSANFGVPQRRRRVFVVGYFGDWRPPAAVLFEPQGSNRNSKESGKKGEKNTRETSQRFNSCCSKDNLEQPYALANTLTRRMYKGINTTLDEGQTPILVLDKQESSETNLCFNIRRLTPIECERLQGFPDNYTLVPWKRKLAPDTPRYKVLGNSMAVPCMKWIGKRISLYEKLKLTITS